MRDNFKRCMGPLLVWEGGYSNHPKDPGGPTNKGVTQKVYDAYRANHGKTKQSVKLITNKEVEDIYKSQYWDPVKGDLLPAGVDLAVFDFAVNSGTARAARALQKCVGAAQDGQVGQVTLDRVAEVQDDALVVAICQERLRFVKTLSTWPTFGAGWKRRIMGEQEGAQDGDKGVIDIGVRMAREEPMPPLPKKEATGKADPTDQKLSTQPEAVGAGTSALSVGGLSFADSITSIGEWVGMTKDQIQPFIDYSPYIKGVFFGLLAFGILGTLGAFLLRKKEGRI